jgi:hypothetical protein
MDILITLGMNVYAYCTDFVINLANIFNLSYYEINFILFCVLYPILIVGSIIAYIIQRLRIGHLKKNLSN